MHDFGYELTRLRAAMAFTSLEIRALALRLEIKRLYPAPHWLYQPRVPRGQPDGGQWTDGGGGDDVWSGRLDVVPVANVTRTATRTVRTVRGRLSATPRQHTEYELAAILARQAVRRAREIDPVWKPATGLYESITGAIRHQREIRREAERFLRESAPSPLIGHNRPPPLLPSRPQMRPPVTLEDILVPLGRVRGFRAKGARFKIRVGADYCSV